MRTLHLLILIGFTAAFARAQDLPQRPVNGIYDDTRALSEESHAQLAKEIETFRTSSGIDAWFAGTTYIHEGQTMRSEARILRQAWSGSRPAVLLLFDRSKKEEMVTFSPILWDVLPTAELFRIRENIHDLMADDSKPPEQRLRESMIELMHKVGALRIRESQTNKLFTHDYLWMLRWFGIALLAGAVVAGIAGIFARRRDLSASRVCFMPSIQVPPRLGAAHGGGTSVAWSDKS
ncbi:MAG: hypothetical protein V4662_15105 [Verrucomicrobiota bacterium]